MKRISLKVIPSVIILSRPIEEFQRIINYNFTGLQHLVEFINPRIVKITNGDGTDRALLILMVNLVSISKGGR